MSNMTVRRGVVAGLGAAAGALAAAALLSTAPIASADNTDADTVVPALAGSALPALVAPPNEYSSELTIYDGTSYTTYDTTWNFISPATTTTSTGTLIGDYYGYYDSSTTDYTAFGTTYEDAATSYAYESVISGVTTNFMDPLTSSLASFAS